MKATILILALMPLTACATSQPAMQGELNAQFGMAVKANASAHAVAPTAAQKTNTFIPANPARTALTRKKYEEGTTDTPQSSGY